ncbi:hypothetical protein OS493_038526 [Desmophyllum pertusum]|uniref:Uncharacterized protein n=1 Tax=Desmophyllum pertusum TaxID=174260 RepID=A0A9X0CGW5_9CNID|nr:hypothetical protein OS493_038526 [Desmophyllum pertusum]
MDSQIGNLEEELANLDLEEERQAKQRKVQSLQRLIKEKRARIHQAAEQLDGDLPGSSEPTEPTNITDLKRLVSNQTPLDGLLQPLQQATSIANQCWNAVPSQAIGAQQSDTRQRTGMIGTSEMFLKPAQLPKVCIEKAVIDNKELRNALNEKFSSLKLKILDFAGDNEYHAYHHMFLRSQAIYVIVFNMAEFAENSFRDINARIKTLHLWFESVCSHVPPKTPIFLVGTHRGHMDKICMESLNGHLTKSLWDLYCDELIMNDVDKLIFFPVENSDGKNDAGVQTLRKKIMFVEEELKETIGHDIPLSWIQIQDEIIKLQEKKEAKFCVSLEEFPRTFDYLICTNWSEETLKYFHEKGLVIYLDKDQELSRLVLLKPEILVDIIIQLVTKQPEMIHQRGFRRDWKLLHTKGMLTKSLLDRILSEAVAVAGK